MRGGGGAVSVSVTCGSGLTHPAFPSHVDPALGSHALWPGLALPAKTPAPPRAPVSAITVMKTPSGWKKEGYAYALSSQGFYRPCPSLSCSAQRAFTGSAYLPKAQPTPCGGPTILASSRQPSQIAPGRTGSPHGPEALGSWVLMSPPREGI